MDSELVLIIPKKLAANQEEYELHITSFLYSHYSCMNNSALLYMAKDHKIYDIIINLNYSYNLSTQPTGLFISPLGNITQIFYQRLGTVHLTNTANELFKERLKHLLSLADKISQLLQILKVPPCASY